eukprot:COSAG02_NODE_257_length_26838_cov_118.324844_12_plen_60_part_00
MLLFLFYRQLQLFFFYKGVDVNVFFFSGYSFLLMGFARRRVSRVYGFLVALCRSPRLGF